VLLSGRLWREVKAEESTWYVADGVLELCLLAALRGQALVLALAVLLELVLAGLHVRCFSLWLRQTLVKLFSWRAMP
jgi:hypothetical protein